MVFSTLFASLVLAQSAQTSPLATVQVYGRAAVQNERRVSLKVKDASLKDVLSKLPKVDYVVDADAFKNRRITLSLSDVPISRALDAIASALDAHWDEQGGVRVLKPGAGFGFGGTAFRSFTMPKELFVTPKDGTAFRSFTPDQMKKFEELQKGLFKDGKPFEPLTSKQLDELRLRYKDAPKFEFRSGADGKPPVFQRIYGIQGERKSDVDALLKSLTPAQKELAKSQGYLKMSDLTPEQRKMTGFGGDGTFEMTITRNGETVKIRS